LREINVLIGLLSHANYDSYDNNVKYLFIKDEVRNMTSEPIAETGYMVLIAGLLEILESTNGLEVTEEMMHTNGKRRGEHVARKLGEYIDPKRALERLIEHSKPYYTIEIERQSATRRGYMAEIRFKDCMIKKLCKNRGISIKNPLCANTKGFIEGALSSMTCMEVDVDTTIVDWNICECIVDFKRKQNKIGFM